MRDERSWGSKVVTARVLGATCNVFAQRRREVPDLLLDARRFPDRRYISQGDRRLTYGQHERVVSSAAKLIAGRGVARGTPVLLLGANAIEWVVSFWSILGLGGIVVLGNAWWSEDELGHALTTTDPALVIGDEKRLAMLPPSQPRTAFAELAGLTSQNSEVDLYAPSDRAAEDDPAVVLFTSGTTGLPKGAVLSHRAIISTLQAILERTRRLPDPEVPLPPPSQALLSLPLFHIGGLQQIITPMVTGGSLVFNEGRFDPARIVDVITRERITVWSAVPTMVSQVLDHLQQTDQDPLSGVRTIGMGGAPVSQELRERVSTWFPDASRGLAVTYGLSEASGVVATGAGAEIRARPGTVGRPLVTSTIRIENPDESGAGEILVQSPSVMLGYWRKQPRSSVSGRWEPGPIGEDRWLRTGDIGRLDRDGYLFVTDRSKDIVIRGGENVATPHVEGRLSAHPAVREVAVFGLPHKTLGEEVAAVVVLQPGTVSTAAELAEFSREKLAHFEVPSQWWFHPGPLPQNATGKILKRSLREEWISSSPA